MNFFLLIISFFIFLFICSLFRFPKLLDDGLYCLVGRKRSGKTTFLAVAAIYYYLRGRPVFSTCKLPCSYLITKDDIGRSFFPKYSVILLDEIGLLYNNRKFKTFPDHVLEYFKLQGHYKHLVICCSQALDFDISIQRLIDLVGIPKKLRFNITYIRWAIRDINFNKEDVTEQTSFISEKIQPISIFAGGLYVIYRPVFYPFYDSFEAPELPKKKFKVPKEMKFKFKRKKYPPALAFWECRLKLTKFYSFLSHRKLTETPQSEPVTDVLALPDTLPSNDAVNAPTGENKPFRLPSLSDVDRGE